MKLWSKSLRKWMDVYCRSMSKLYWHFAKIVKTLFCASFVCCFVIVLGRLSAAKIRKWLPINWTVYKILCNFTRRKLCREYELALTNSLFWDLFINPLPSVYLPSPMTPVFQEKQLFPETNIPWPLRVANHHSPLLLETHLWSSFFADARVNSFGEFKWHLKRSIPSINTMLWFYKTLLVVEQ